MRVDQRSIRRWLISGPTCASALLLSSAPAGAQQASRAADGLEEVTVQARRVDENLQNVPVTISVLTAETLERNNIRTVGDSLLMTPSVSTTIRRNAFSPDFVFIRGVKGVVTYFADAPFTAQGSQLYFDLENTQVLKGPQGTLFGVATNGGAILLSPVKPSNELSGYASLEAGGLSHLVTEGAINLPIVDDKVLLRASFISSNEDGYVLNTANNETLGDSTYWAGRLSLVLKPTDYLENYTVANYADYEGTSLWGVLGAVDPNGAAARRYGADVMNGLLAEQQALGPYRVAGIDHPDVHNWLQQLTVVNKTTFTINDKVSIRNTVGYDWQKEFGGAAMDADGTRLPIFHQRLHPYTDEGAGFTNRRWSEELQLIGTRLFDVLDLQAGGFVSRTDMPNAVPRFDVALGSLRAAIDELGSRTKAVYGQGTYDLSNLAEGLSFTAGYRYTWDTRTQNNKRLSLPSQVPDRILIGEQESSKGSYTLGVQYQLSPDSMIYFTNAKGYSAGGLQLTAPAGFRTYAPESLTNYEIGIKSDFAINDMEFRTNISAYYGKLNDLQVTQVVALQNELPPAPPTPTSLITNAASAEVRGVEAQITALPIESVELNAYVAYNDPRFEDYTSLDPATLAVVDLSSSPFQRNSKWKMYFNASYRLPAPSSLGDMRLTADYSRQSKSYGGVPGPVLYEEEWVPAFGTLNLSFNWSDVMGREGLEVSLAYLNVNENTLTGGGSTTWASQGFYSYYPQAPRRFLARVKYNF